MSRLLQIALAILVGLVAYQFAPVRERAKSLRVSVQSGVDGMVGKSAVDAGQHAKRILIQKQFDRAVQQFERLRGQKPKSLEDLVDEGLLQKAEMLDEWGQMLQVEANHQGIFLRSAGPDGAYHTADDWVFRR